MMNRITQTYTQRVALLATLAVALLIVAMPVQAKDLRIALASEPSSMDPHYHNLAPNNAVARSIFTPLILTDEKQRLTPGLATSWRPVNQTTWEFKLRKGVKFHDGTPFSADDVVFTFKRAANVPNSPSSFGTYLKGKKVVKVNQYTVRIVTAKPYPLMPNDMSTFVVISSKIGKNASTEDYNTGKTTIGTGPFKFVKWVPGDSIVLKRNKNYWGKKPEWTNVTLKAIKSGPTRVASLLAGDVDMIEGVPTTDIERLKRNKKLDLSQGISNRVIYLHLDHDRRASPYVKSASGGSIDNPLRKLKVRQAISMAINRDAIVKRVMEGVAIKAGQLLPEGFFGVSKKLKPVRYDLKRAKQLLKEAGYPKGFQLTIHGPNDRYINDAKIAEAVAQMLTRAGIKTSVETMTRSVFFSNASRGGPNKTPKFSFILVGWGAGSGEASSPLKSLLHTYDKSRGFGASNRGRYSNPKLDELLEKALATVNDKKRAALLAQATEVGIKDVGIIPLHYQVNTWAARKGIRYKARTDEGTLPDSAYSVNAGY